MQTLSQVPPCRSSFSFPEGSLPPAPDPGPGLSVGWAFPSCFYAEPRCCGPARLSGSQPSAGEPAPAARPAGSVCRLGIAAPASEMPAARPALVEGAGSDHGPANRRRPDITAHKPHQTAAVTTQVM